MPEITSDQASHPDRDKLARLIYAAYHGIPVESVTDEDWPANDRMVKRWTATADAVLASELLPTLVASPAATSSSPTR